MLKIEKKKNKQYRLSIKQDIFFYFLIFPEDKNDILSPLVLYN